jgi:Di-sulfide bridge nucleocytoplasmic transport domain
MHTGSRSEFESPSRSRSVFPNLRAPTGQTTLFSNLPRPVSPDKPLPSVPNLDSFKTPRKFEPEFFSSGGETPNTPDTVDADSEATPDPKIRGGSPSKLAMGLFSSRANGSSMAAVDEKKRAPSPKKKRDSWISRLVSSPSRREALTSALKPYSTKAEKRVNKRRARTKTHSRSADLTPDSGSEDDSGKNVKSKKEGGGFHGTIASYLRLVEDHPNAPTILITYLQLLSNFLLICFSIYVVSSLWSGILGDVDKGVRETQSETMLEVMACKQDWLTFRCEERPERTRELCETLAKCIAKDPEKIARAQVSAKTFAKIINDFAEPISLKAMVSFSLWRDTMLIVDRYSTFPSLPSFGIRQMQLGMAFATSFHKSIISIICLWLPLLLQHAIQAMESCIPTLLTQQVIMDTCIPMVPWDSFQAWNQVLVDFPWATEQMVLNHRHRKQEVQRSNLILVRYCRRLGRHGSFPVLVLVYM